MTQAANLAALGTNAGTTGILAASGGGTAGTAGTANFKNRIINGDFLIWQRGTSLTTASNQVYGFADRWLTNAGASTTWSQSTDAPAGFKYSVSCAGSTFNGINQRIESFNCTDLAGQAVTFSFWAKQSSGSSSININLSYANSADNFSATTGIVETAISASPSSSWTRYSYTYTMPAGVANGLQIILFNAAAASTTLYTGIQVELGTAATNFDVRSYGTELILCQRYYEVVSQFVGRATSASNAEGTVTFMVQKRAAPSIGIINGTNTLLELAVALRSFTSASGFLLVNGGYLNLGGASGMTSGNLCVFYSSPTVLSASAEL